MNIDLVHAFFVVCWVSITAFTGVFFYVFVRWILYLLWPKKTIKVNHFHNGELVESRVLDLTSDEPLVRQLRNGGGRRFER